MEDIAVVLKVTRVDDIKFSMILNNPISNGCDSNNVYIYFSISYLNEKTISINIVLLVRFHVSRQEINRNILPFSTNVCTLTVTNPLYLQY